MEKYAVVVAGGSGLRMGTVLPKQFLLLRDHPVLWYSLETFLRAYSDLQIILVLNEHHFEKGETIRNTCSDPQRIILTNGGETRFHSVQNGLQHIQKHSIVFVHDGVRCLLTEDLVHRCYEGALEKGNAIPATTAVDSIRMETVEGPIQVDRDKIRLIQTPQTFYSEIIKSAFEQDFHESFTDEASVVERLGVKINLIEGESTNIKITRPLDLLIAEKVLEDREFGL